jgi:hypothetical protein
LTKRCEGAQSEGGAWAEAELLSGSAAERLLQESMGADVTTVAAAEE